MEQQNLKSLEKFIGKYWPNVKGTHFTTLTDIIYMTAMRHEIKIPELLIDLRNGILDKSFYESNSGNIYNFILPKYIDFAKRIKDINIGSNGGMANIGKGEWLLSLCSGINPETEKPYVNIIKQGNGDIKRNNIIDNNKIVNEEVKWNGGKVSLEVTGRETTEKFNKLIDITDKNWVPFRKGDKKYSEEIKVYNAIYWQSISGEENSKLTCNELKQKIINMSFTKLFEKSDLFIMFNDDGKFQRFCNIEEAKAYYSDKLDKLQGTKSGFECRAKQSNPIALYCYVF